MVKLIGLKVSLSANKYSIKLTALLKKIMMAEINALV